VPLARAGGFFKETGNIPIAGSAAHGRLIVFLATIVFFSVLNTTMFNVSLPDIAEQFHLLPSQVSLVVSGYGVVSGTSICK